jgi:hypothetical protein
MAIAKTSNLTKEHYTNPKDYLIKSDEDMKKLFTQVNSLNTTGAIGGTSSAGSGKQYVAITINGVTFKVLHDGTI